MALSNTATPKYYGMFRDAVIRGEIPICKEIEMEMNRIDELIDKTQSENQLANASPTYHPPRNLFVAKEIAHETGGILRNPSNGCNRSEQ